MKLSLFLRKYRFNHALTQTQLAEKAGLTPYIICELEKSNHPNLRASSLIKLSEALEISLDKVARMYKEDL